MEILRNEMRKCFDFFMDYSNHDETSDGYGLILDRTNDLGRCSIAAVGSKLSALVIGVENGYITYDEALKITKGTLRTLLFNVDHHNGFYAHFVDMKTAKRLGKTEYSTIDTGLCLNGVIIVEAYFNDEEITDMATKLITRVNYKDMQFEKDGKSVLHMAINPDKDGSYASELYSDGYIWHWDMYAEQLMMYFQAAMQDDFSDEEIIDLYNGFDRFYDEKNDMIYTPDGSLFIYQFSHGWFPFQKYLDCNGVNWFENSKKAAMLNREFCINDQFENHNEYFWGLSAGDTDEGYRVFGADPRENKVIETNATIQPYALISCINFMPEIVIESVEEIMKKYPNAFGEYGFSDGLNPENGWVCPNYLGIDKGITILMLDNYFNGNMWKIYESSKFVQKAIKRLKMTEV